MYSRLQLVKRFLNYYLLSSNSRGHGVHSPFVFDFITRVLNDKRYFYAYDRVEWLRQRMIHDKRMLTVEDLGAGSAGSNAQQRTIASIARLAPKSTKYGQLLFRIVNHYKPRCIVELGSSLGISTAYLASANLQARIYTIEGAEEIAGIARENFELLGLDNIELVRGDFDDTLSGLLRRIPAVDLAFIDGNHQQEPTLRYFELLLEHTGSPSVLIFDDIHWSAEMETAWARIKLHPRVTLTIDLFFIGLVFFSDAFKSRQDFSIRF